MHVPRDSARAGRRVCIVTPGYISATPRVVREADALAAAGFDVRVVCTQGQLSDVREFDRSVITGRPWQVSMFRWSKSVPDERWAFYRTGLRHRAVQAVARAAGGVEGVAELSEGRGYPVVARLSAQQPADIFIGHYPTGLAAASWAASRYDAAIGYDVEDLYPETFPDSEHWADARRLILTIERRYVRRCRHISAVSGPVADAFAERFQVPRPTVVHNAHPWTERSSLDGLVKDRRGPDLSLFWYSQTVGLDRGIQDAIRAMGLAKVPVQLHLRGFTDSGTRSELERIAAEAGVRDRLHFHPACAPAELLSRAVEHDVGLALEVGDALSRSLAVSNKLLFYLVAGLAVVASDLPGQRSVIDTCPGAAALYQSGDIETMARQLRGWAIDRPALDAAKAASLRAGQQRWNWEHEAAHLVSAVSAALGTNQSAQGVA
jgi:glycosyltransferase involved in cell wall biosynthesis